MGEGNRKHVLVIDDDAMMLKLIKEHLHDKYDVAVAKGGAMAYKFLEKKDTDMILLDYEMPEENGPAVYGKIRQMPGREELPIVFITGASDDARISEIEKLDPLGYLLKPIDKATLLGRIGELID